jgi:hypothetical protein
MQHAAFGGAATHWAANVPLERNPTVLFMIVERYRPGVADQIYRRVRQRGRMMPPGLEYVDSWVTMDVCELTNKSCWSSGWGPGAT